MGTLTVLVIRAKEELGDGFKQKLSDAHPDKELVFKDIDPRSAKEAAAAARAEGDVIVVLRQDPLIKELLDDGVPLIPILPGDGPLQRVADFQVVFVDYIPIAA